jgi:hypothetical protein
MKRAPGRGLPPSRGVRAGPGTNEIGQSGLPEFGVRMRDGHRIMIGHVLATRNAD